MLSSRCFTREWIEHWADNLCCRNPVLLEKAIVALQLVGHLAESSLPFQFKGGTSLLLLIQPIRRLSIDVDIVTQATQRELDDVLRRVQELSPLTRIEHDDRRDRELPPKKHYRAYYPSVFPPPENHVLLDVLFEAPVAGEPLTIVTPFIEPQRGVQVIVPGVNGLLGDKLSAFAPRTIGILYHLDRAAGIVKQLFDVGVLFEHATDLAAVASAYEAVHANQCTYRQPYTHDQTLDDTIGACLHLTQRGLRGAPGDEPNGALLHDGVDRLESHIINQPFGLQQARVAAGRAASVAAWIKRRTDGVTIQSLRYDANQIDQLRSATIGPPWQALRRLRGPNPEAFFHWLRAQQILESER